MGSDPERSVVNAHGESHDVRRLFVGDSSVIPATLSVNPSLTISAVCERAAAELVRRSADYGLPPAPPGFRHRAPRTVVGERVVPGPRAA